MNLIFLKDLKLYKSPVLRLYGVCRQESSISHMFFMKKMYFHSDMAGSLLAAAAGFREGI